MNTAIIEIIIGLVLAYSLLSLIVSQMVEALRGANNFRARYLLTWVVDNLTYDLPPDELTARQRRLWRVRGQDGTPTHYEDRPTLTKATEFADYIITHPLISMKIAEASQRPWWNLVGHLKTLLQQLRVVFGGTVWLKADTRTDYVDFNTLATVLMQELRNYVDKYHPFEPGELPPEVAKPPLQPDDSPQILQERDRIYAEQFAARKKKVDRLYLERLAAMTGVNPADERDANARRPAQSLLSAEWARGEGMSIPPQLVRVLLKLDQLVDTVNDQTDNLEKRVVDWFDKQGRRMSAVFKRHAFWWTGFVGLLVAITLNVDSIGMSRLLWEDPVLRESVAEAAGQIAAQRADELAQQDATPTTDTTPPASLDAGQAPPQGEAPPQDQAPSTTPDTSTTDDPLLALQSSIDTLVESGLPVGWVWESWDNRDDPAATDSRNLYNIFGGGIDIEDRLWFVLQKVVGLMLTAIAISQGSDFWFNVLRNLAGRGRN